MNLFNGIYFCRNAFISWLPDLCNLIKEVKTTINSLFSHSRFGHYFYSNHYGHAPRGPRVVKNQISFIQMKLLSFCASIEPKLQKLRKTVKTVEMPIFFNLSSIFAYQMFMSLFSGWWHFFWHPWGCWGRIHIEDIMVLVFVFKFVKQFKIKSEVTFVGLWLKKLYIATFEP